LRRSFSSLQMAFFRARRTRDICILLQFWRIVDRVILEVLLL
jgi:hypothetical protein